MRLVLGKNHPDADATTHVQVEANIDDATGEVAATVIEVVIEAGARMIGQNYVQEAQKLLATLGEAARVAEWHMIGHLQRNKVGRAASRDETRPILTGVLVTIVGGVLKMVATDSGLCSTYLRAPVKVP